MRNWLTFDGVSTKDFGVYISGGGTYNAPARSREVISVPGRNGDLIIDNGRYENTEVVYHAFIYRNFGVNVEGLRNLLLSKTGYVRIEDTYHPEEFRLGVYSGDFQTDVVDWLEAGEFDLTFNCKPQRFLKSGEEVCTFTANGSLFNETRQIAKPIVNVYTDGTSTNKSIIINGTTFTIGGVYPPANTYFEVDCDIMDMRLMPNGTNANRYFSGGFPTLSPSANTIYLPASGITKIEIIPRWWVL